MKKPNLLPLDKLKYNVSIGLTITVIIYSICLISLHQHYEDKAEIEKLRILQNYYNKILEVSTNKINSISQKLSRNLQSQHTSLTTNTSDLQICSDKCINYNLFRFGALVDRYIPDFIHYKIELNNKFLYSNVKSENYQLEKVSHFNDYNQFNIRLAIDKLYWRNVKAEIKKPFWTIALFLSSNILLLYILSKILIKIFNKEYVLYYQNKYKEELEQIKFNHIEELENSKSSLMNKIWNLNFSKQKDLEINCLFAGEANKIVLPNEDVKDQETMIKNYRLKNFSDKVPCSIVLYQEDKIEEINVTQLINLFNDRFNQEDENISVNIESEEKVVYFSSRASLYQIIYSLISYLVFLISKQSSATKYNIKLIIGNIKRSIQLRFEYDASSISEEKELLKMSSCFFKTHANPFLLNVNQIFNILRNNGFDCNVSHNQFNVNIIDISQKKQNNIQQIEETDNIIYLSSIINKQK